MVYQDSQVKRIERQSKMKNNFNNAIVLNRSSYMVRECHKCDLLWQITHEFHDYQKPENPFHAQTLREIIKMKQSS